MEFLDVYNKLNSLDEVYSADFKTFGSDDYYHFYEDLTDLLNSLTTKTIYSNKNLQDTQKDRYAPKGYSYVCMTTTQEGKKWLTDTYTRPFGLSFTEQHLVDLCNSKSYLFDPNKSYNQFGEKSNYGHTITKRGKVKELPAFADRNFSDFEIFAIGELSDGEYFISGGQGNTHLWDARRFTDKQVYETLREWFIKNMNLPGEAKKYYWFKDSNLGNVTKTYKGKPIDVDGNLNKNYVPRADYESVKEKTFKDTYNSTIAFTGIRIPFKEIIGIGPINLWDIEGQRSLIFLNYVNSTTKHGYLGPMFYGRNIGASENDFVDEVTFTNSNKKNGEYHLNLLADENLFNKMCDIYNEHEFRIYVPNGGSFKFQPNDITALVLPSIYENVHEEINLKILTNKLIKNARYGHGLSNVELTTLLATDGIITFVHSPARTLQLAIAGQATISSSTYKIINQIFNLFDGAYKDVAVEIIEDHTAKTGNNDVAFNKDDTTTDILPERSKLKSKNHTRYLLNVWPDLKSAQVIPGFNNTPSVIADVEAWSGEEPITARLGSEVIITALDEDNRKYVLFVENAHKAAGFLELPGGGLYELPNSTTAFEDIVRHRLHFKGGIEDNDITDLHDSGKALLLYEKGVAQKNIPWEWSYYRLYQAHYNKVISKEELEYQFNNKSLAASMKIAGEQGYTAFLQWIPVDTLDLNTHVVNRYSNIINIIKTN